MELHVPNKYHVDPEMQKLLKSSGLKLVHNLSSHIHNRDSKYFQFVVLKVLFLEGQ